MMAGFQGHLARSGWVQMAKGLDVPTCTLPPGAGKVQLAAICRWDQGLAIIPPHQENNGIFLKLLWELQVVTLPRQAVVTAVHFARMRGVGNREVRRVFGRVE